METVPAQEIAVRLDLFQQSLKENGLDGALILHNVGIYYFSGTIQTSFLFIPAQGESLLLVVKSWDRAKRESPLKRIQHIQGRRELPGALTKAGYSHKGRMGLELDVLPSAFFLWLRKTFPSCEWKDISRLIRTQRMIKSEYEVAQIRRALEIEHIAFTDLRRFIREGMTELEVDGRLAMVARKNGHQGIVRMRAWNQEMTYAHVLSGPNGDAASYLNSAHGGVGTCPCMPQGAGHKTIRRNEPIEVDLGLGVNGYVGDQSRTYVIGELPESLQEAHDCSRRIHDRFAETARPGVRCHEMYGMAAAEAEKAGLAGVFMGHGRDQVRFVGHGIGLEVDELPILAPGFDIPLEAGMVLALEPKFVLPQEGVVGLEDDYLVTEKGVERLTLTEQEVLRVIEAA
ncbi:MAG: M24 family metallopeptidase [Thermodesulfobacteriota bacterium]